LNRDSIQSSIRKQFGLQSGRQSLDVREEGVARMLVDVYRSYDQELSDDLLHRWHGLLLDGVLVGAGSYRTHAEPIQVVSGASYSPVVHFEAPPSVQVPGQM